MLAPADATLADSLMRQLKDALVKPTRLQAEIGVCTCFTLLEGLGRGSPIASQVLSTPGLASVLIDCLRKWPNTVAISRPACHTLWLLSEDKVSADDLLAAPGDAVGVLLSVTSGVPGDTSSSAASDKGVAAAGALGALAHLMTKGTNPEGAAGVAARCAASKASLSVAVRLMLAEDQAWVQECCLLFLLQIVQHHERAVVAIASAHPGLTQAVARVLLEQKESVLMMRSSACFLSWLFIHVPAAAEAFSRAPPVLAALVRLLNHHDAETRQAAVCAVRYVASLGVASWAVAGGTIVVHGAARRALLRMPTIPALVALLRRDGATNDVAAHHAAVAIWTLIVRDEAATNAFVRLASATPGALESMARQLLRCCRSEGTTGEQGMAATRTTLGVLLAMLTTDAPPQQIRCISRVPGLLPDVARALQVLLSPPPAAEQRDVIVSVVILSKVLVELTGEMVDCGAAGGSLSGGSSDGGGAWCAADAAAAAAGAAPGLEEALQRWVDVLPAVCEKGSSAMAGEQGASAKVLMQRLRRARVGPSDDGGGGKGQVQGSDAGAVECAEAEGQGGAGAAAGAADGAVSGAAASEDRGAGSSGPRKSESGAACAPAGKGLEAAAGAPVSPEDLPSSYVANDGGSVGGSGGGSRGGSGGVSGGSCGGGQANGDAGAGPLSDTARAEEEADANVVASILANGGSVRAIAVAISSGGGALPDSGPPSAEKPPRRNSPRWPTVTPTALAAPRWPPVAQQPQGRLFGGGVGIGGASGGSGGGGSFSGGGLSGSGMSGGGLSSYGSGEVAAAAAAALGQEEDDQAPQTPISMVMATTMPPELMGGDEDSEEHCEVCGKTERADGVRLRMCRGCRGVMFCSYRCSRAAWVDGGHKQVCLAAQGARQQQREQWWQQQLQKAKEQEEEEERQREEEERERRERDGEGREDGEEGALQQQEEQEEEERQEEGDGGKGEEVGERLLKQQQQQEE